MKLKEGILDISDIFSLAFGVIKDRFKVITAILVTVNLPMALVSAYIVSRNIENVSVEEFGATGIISIISVIIGVVASMGIIHITEAHLVRSEEVSYKDAFSKGFKLFFRSILINICAFIVLTVGFVFLIIPGIYLAGAFSFIYQAVVIKNTGVIDTLKYSKKTVKGHWWKVFFTGLIANVLAMIVIMIFDFMSGNFIGSIISSIVTALSTGFTTIVLTVLFLNLDFYKNKDKQVLEKEIDTFLVEENKDNQLV